MVECSLGLDNADTPRLVQVMKWLNLFNAALVILTGFLAFVFASDFSLLGLYLIVFASLFCCFELKLSFIEATIAANCGFMFKWWGRLLLFIFIASLAMYMNLDGLGWAVGIFTCCNVIFNIYVICTHEGYHQKLLEDGQVRGGASSSSQSGTSTKQTEKKTEPKSDFESAMELGEVAVVLGNNKIVQEAVKKELKVGWEMFIDEDSNAKYWYNKSTNETRWEEPV